MRTPSRTFCCYLPLLVLCCACLKLPSFSGANGEANSTISCNFSSLTQCANVGNDPYPFGASTACAASPSYVLSNCTRSSTDQAYWNSFSDAALGVVGSPAVTAVTDVAGYSVRPGESRPFYDKHVTFKLSWNKSLVDLDSCPPLFSSTNLSLYNIPSSINLTLFPESSTLSFSDDNAIFLFNCARSASAVLDPQLGSMSYMEQESDSGCSPYKALFPSLAETPCIQWVIWSSMKVLMLQHVLDTLACSHFMFGTPSLSTHLESYTNFSPAVFELRWTDIQCSKCTEAFGYCIYQAAGLRNFSHCECDNGKMVDFNTQHCPSGPKRVSIPPVAVAIIIVVGVLALLGLCLLIKVGFCMLKKILRKKQSVSYRLKHSLDLLDLDGLTERPTEYSYSSLSSATKSFTNLVGEGGFGKVYKGTLTTHASKTHGGASEQQIAVKVLEAKSKQRKKQFLNEVITIGKIHHVNVVRLFGFCTQEDHEMLVYEYVVNGSLDKWLFDKKGEPQEHVLDWGQRLSIALGVARGLGYLHEECRHRTVHCDIKPQNILLDADMQPKIADFGLARLMSRDESKVVTFARGTPGYMAPEFWRGGESQLSTKFDVYSYGMVLLELISGRRNFDTVALANGSSFPAMAFKGAMEGNLESIIDPRLDIMSDVDDARKQLQWQQVKTAAFIALWCIQDHPARRPHMSEVVKYLEGGATVSDCPPQPTISMSCASYPQQDFHLIGSHHDDECTPLSGGR